MENLGNDFATTLNGAIDSSTTAITVTSGTGAPAVNFRIRVDDELMLVTSKGAGTNWTVQRNIEGTSAASHANGADVAHVISFGGIETFGRENWVAIFPGVEPGKVFLVKDRYQLNVFDELLIDDGELIVEGQVTVMTL